MLLPIFHRVRIFRVRLVCEWVSSIFVCLFVSEINKKKKTSNLKEQNKLEEFFVFPTESSTQKPFSLQCPPFTTTFTLRGFFPPYNIWVLHHIPCILGYLMSIEQRTWPFYYCFKFIDCRFNQKCSEIRNSETNWTQHVHIAVQWRKLIQIVIESVINTSLCYNSTHYRSIPLIHTGTGEP